MSATTATAAARRLRAAHAHLQDRSMHPHAARPGRPPPRTAATAATAAAAPAPAFHSEDLFDPAFCWGAAERAELDGAGHVVLPGLLSTRARALLLEALARVDRMNEADGPARQRRLAALRRERELCEAAGERERAAVLDWDLWEEARLGVRRVAAEHDDLIEATISHPQMLLLASHALGCEDVRFDHCALNTRHAGNPGQSWHTHGAADLRDHAGAPWRGHGLPTREDLSRVAGLVRIFFYVNGTASRDGNLKVCAHVYV